MDDLQLTAAVVALLSPYLTEAAKAGAGKAGEMAVEGVGKLYTALARRFSKNRAAEEALERLEKTPELPGAQAAFRSALEQRIAEDQELRAELVGLVERLAPGQTARVTGDRNLTIQISGNQNQVGWPPPRSGEPS